MKRLRFDRFAVPALAIIIQMNAGWAESTENVADVVRDKAIREPLIGVNVILQGTSLGLSSPVEGRYSVTNDPPGI